jgi:protocatechuate 3,4-dioxygenase beta subunit
MILVARWLPAAALLIVAGCAGAQSPAPAATASPTASAVAAATPSPTPSPTACAAHAVTPAVTEGPYFKAGSPERSVLYESGMAGTHLVLTGRVLTSTCQPVPGAVLDFWQADAGGTYDNSGYRLRGHQTVAADGTFRLETVIPGLYPGRTEHIHVKVQAPGGPVLTTQLFFPGVASNAGDSIFAPALLIALTDAADGGKTGAYDFYL